ncbi:MAG: aspartate aminotransferase family protein [Thermodesulfobacteriota bacterium]|nr:aspartate aminotransferase family protein [Thermodesulfobacteriota bacterium]
MNTYTRLPINLVKGKGCRVWDDKGTSYLDMVAGIAVCNLGHAHPRVIKALETQAHEMFHCSNLYGIPIQENLAEMIVKNTFDSKVFFCNSGAEANEAAIKLARRCMIRENKVRSKIITCANSFHGRTLATVAATGQDRFKVGFDPIPEGFDTVAYGDMDALETALDDHTGAIMLEPIQGEGGVNVPPPGYLKKVRQFCDDHGLLLILDEVQTGMGRTGRLFGYMHEDVKPDIMTLAKALGNGFPVGALIARPDIASGFTPGSHASTFGGNPLAMACGVATMEVMLEENIAAASAEQGKYLMDELKDLSHRHACIQEIRGKGLMIGVDMDQDISSLVPAGLEKGILLNVIKGYTLRLIPPLIISRTEIDQAIKTIDLLLKEKGL